MKLTLTPVTSVAVELAPSRIVIDHVDCKSCGKSYDAERKDPRRGPTCCGECGCIDHRLVKVTTLR
jgi:predicted Zn-ribbon and HTH transcriptional regulator